MISVSFLRAHIFLIFIEPTLFTCAKIHQRHKPPPTRITVFSRSYKDKIKLKQNIFHCQSTKNGDTKTQ